MKYISTFELFESYNRPRSGGKKRWSVKYKKKIDCSNPKGFSQKQYCKRKKIGGDYKTESIQNYEHLQEIIRNLNDMSLELWDKDFNVQINENVLSPDEKHIVINIYKRGGQFNYDEIKDTFLEMYNYLNSEGLTLVFIDATLKRGPGYYEKYPLGIKDGDLLFLHDDKVIDFKSNVTYIAREGEKVDKPIDQIIIKFKQ